LKSPRIFHAWGEEVSFEEVVAQDSLLLRSQASSEWSLVATETGELQDCSTGSSSQPLPVEIAQT